MGFLQGLTGEFPRCPGWELLAHTEDPGEPIPGKGGCPSAYLLGLFCKAWSPVWLMPVRVTPSAAFFFSLRLRVRFRSADHSWAAGTEGK